MPLPGGCSKCACFSYQNRVILGVLILRAGTHPVAVKPVDTLTEPFKQHPRHGYLVTRLTTAFERVERLHLLFHCSRIFVRSVSEALNRVTAWQGNLRSFFYTHVLLLRPIVSDQRCGLRERRQCRKEQEGGNRWQPFCFRVSFRLISVNILFLADGEN